MNERDKTQVMDAQERAKLLWNNLALSINDSQCHAIAEQIRQAEQAARERALGDAARDVCAYCDGRFPGWDAAKGPNSAGNWTHLVDGKPASEVLCQASSIFARIAFERGALKETK